MKKSNENTKRKTNNYSKDVLKYVVIGILLFAMVGSMFAGLISAVQ